MKTITKKKKTESTKHTIEKSAEKSKAKVRELLESTISERDENEKSIQLLADSVLREVNSVSAEMLKTAMGKSLEFNESTLDSLINSYSNQMEMNMEFNSRLLDFLKDTDGSEQNDLWDLIEKQFEESQHLIVNNTKDVLNLYSRHNKMTLDFNRIFRDNIFTQIEALSNIQKKGSNEFTEWAADWWTQNAKPGKH